MKPGLLFAGTDDGNVWKSASDGASWESLNGRFPGLPNELYVARIEPSHFDSLTFWVAFDNHRYNDFTPYLYATNDGGKTFRSIVNNLPKDAPGDFLHVIREDPTNASLLFVGSSVAVYASIDKGATWTRFMSGLPTVPVYDLQIHPRDHELIAATHGRSLWIADITPLQQITPTVLAAEAHLFEPHTAYQWGQAPNLMASGNGNAQAFFAVPSPTYGADISYRLGAAVSGTPRVIITNVAGDTLANLPAASGAGVHTVTWNFRSTARPAAAAAPLSPSEKRDSVIKAARATPVLDSLVKAGYDSTAIARAKQLLNPPAGGGGFGGRGGGRRGRCWRTRGAWAASARSRSGTRSAPVRVKATRRFRALGRRRAAVARSAAPSPRTCGRSSTSSAFVRRQVAVASAAGSAAAPAAARRARARTS